ncbi:His/Gly/Thr/Pro-type tRNA ligase C-terminal domain-containing protein [Leptospira borgpetersenii]|nr:His/Gly/Thr/Pro-type tRNA ligase C-terminal domain-containing protein [Leptospira borgpetersenii]
MLDSAKIGKQIQVAEKKGYRYVLFLGESEIRTETVQIKDLVSGEQKSLPRKGLSDILKKDFRL